ncbi:Hypothetical protein I595_1934 [Croceitalea dokdonensis DOKDO 023]|uniref:Uncharacterized protein n=1 Tax=Croceitalea dokdonensis DOKDO 023 TaxID=1300341 RepID=A0A0N8H437_9FLAO|nr:Hypothetical protein I595_1934 [Croceitalea dokdonensis DOKDO 023]
MILSRVRYDKCHTELLLEYYLPNHPSLMGTHISFYDGKNWLC